MRSFSRLFVLAVALVADAFAQSSLAGIHFKSLKRESLSFPKMHDIPRVRHGVFSQSVLPRSDRRSRAAHGGLALIRREVRDTRPNASRRGRNGSRR